MPGGGRQRRWSLALVAVLVTLGSALAFVVLWMNAGDRKPVLALNNDVAAGQIIEADDLKVVRVSADGGVELVASSASDDVVGQPATTNLLAGSLLVAEAVGLRRRPGPGHDRDRHPGAAHRDPVRRPRDR